MRALDVLGLVVAALVLVRAGATLTGQAVSWSAARRWATASTAALGVAAAAGGVPLGPVAVVVGAVHLHGSAWAWAGRRLRTGIPATVTMVLGTLLGFGLLVQTRLGDGVPSVALASAGVATAAALALARRPVAFDRILDHGPLLLVVGLVGYVVAAASGGGATAAVPLGGSEVQVGDLARFLTLAGTALVAADRPSLARAVNDRASLLPGAPDLVTMWPLLAAWGVALLLAAFSRDFGGAALLFVELVVVTCAASGRAWPLVAAVPALGAAGVAAHSLTGHVRGRFTTWLDPGSLEPGHQHVTAMSNWSEGGWFGLGWGAGTPGSIYAVRTDYVLAAVGEELGAIGGLVAVGLVAGLATCAAVVASRRRPRPAAVALAVAVFLAFQAAVVVGGSSGALPLTGVPFPFLSAGSSALAVNTFAVGVLAVAAGSPRPSTLTRPHEELVS